MSQRKQCFYSLTNNYKKERTHQMNRTAVRNFNFWYFSYYYFSKGLPVRK